MTDALRRADPEQPIKACPGWAVSDLASHLIGVHRWARTALDSENAPHHDRTHVTGDFVEAYVVASQELLGALRQREADAPAWTFDPSNRTASFWHRRQLHEVAMHRWDVKPYTFDDDLAVDAIEEVVSFMLPRMQAAGRATLAPGTLDLVVPQRSWAIGTGIPHSRVETSPSDLLLMLWGRDGRLPDAWGDAKLTP